MSGEIGRDSMIVCSSCVIRGNRLCFHIEDEVSVYRNSEGAWVVAGIIEGYRVARRYYGYTKREALALFNQEAM